MHWVKATAQRRGEEEGERRRGCPKALVILARGCYYVFVVVIILIIVFLNISLLLLLLFLLQLLSLLFIFVITFFSLLL